MEVGLDELPNALRTGQKLYREQNESLQLIITLHTMLLVLTVAMVSVMEFLVIVPAMRRHFIERKVIGSVMADLPKEMCAPDLVAACKEEALRAERDQDELLLDQGNEVPAGEADDGKKKGADAGDGKKDDGKKGPR